MKTCALLLSLLVALAGCPAWAEGDYTPVPESLRELDLRIAALEAQRAGISTTGPKVATCLGVGVGALGAIMLVPGIKRTVGCDQGCERGYSQGTLWAATAFLAVGLVQTSISGAIWAHRAQRRNAIDAERESLIKERDGLAATLSRLELRSPYRDGTQFVTLGVRF